jgi:pilus assembly protein Flp/PilA
MSIVRRFLCDETATTAIEYAVIGALISIVIVTSATIIGTSLNAKFQKVATGLT